MVLFLIDLVRIVGEEGLGLGYVEFELFIRYLNI